MPRHRSAKSILDLPQLKETWFVLIHQMRAWVDEEGSEPYRPWIAFVVIAETGMIQNLSTVAKQPDDKEISALIFKAIKESSPMMPAKPHRPTVVVIEDEAIAASLAAEFADFEIEVVYAPRPPEANEIIASLEEAMGGNSVPGLLSVKGVSPHIAGQLFEAAALFYDASPWDMLTDIDPLMIEVSGDKRKRTVVVMGGGGIEYGLAVYNSWKDYLRMFEFAGDPMKALSPSGNHALYFNEMEETPFDDLDAAEKYGWTLCEDELYPVPTIAKLSDESFTRPPLADILWYEAVLRALPIFIDEHLEEDDDSELVPVVAKISVETAAGRRDVVVTYPAGEVPDHLLDMVTPSLPSEEDMGDFRRAMEGMLANIGASLGGAPATDSALDEAQELMYEAWEERSPAKRIAKAKQALKISPDCADAYVLLAEQSSKTKTEQLQLYEQGVAAGERALGDEFFEENAGHFWGLIETRPYMRARAGVANTLWSMDRLDEAATHYREILRLNPGDNQGVRYSLLNILLSTNKDQAAAALLKEYKEDGMAEWGYAKALLGFRKSGNNPASQKLLRAAIKQNPHVPAFLTGKKRLPPQLPQFIGFGDENEAISYASGNLKTWRNTPGAIDWLKSMMK